MLIEMPARLINQQSSINSARLRVLRALYVQKHSETFYYLPPCPRGEERSDEPCGHGDRPTTDRASAHHGRRGAGSKPVPCTFSRTVDRASAFGTPAFARQGSPHEHESFDILLCPRQLWPTARRHRRGQGEARLGPLG